MKTAAINRNRIYQPSFFDELAAFAFGEVGMILLAIVGVFGVMIGFYMLALDFTFFEATGVTAVSATVVAGYAATN